MNSPFGEFQFIGWRDTRSISFPGESERVGDLVAQLERVEPPGQPWLVPVEVQIEPDPLMFGRLLEYLGRLWRSEKPSPERGDRFWLAAVVLNLTGFGRSSRDFEWTSGGCRACLRVAEKNVAAMNAADTLANIAADKLSRPLFALIPLMQGGGEPAIIEEWKRLVSAERDIRRRVDYAALAIIFAEATKRRQIWKEALKEWNMTQSITVLEWQAEAKAAAVVDFLEARFQAVPSDLAGAIRSMTDIQKVSALVKLAAKSTSLDQFRKDAGL